MSKFSIHVVGCGRGGTSLLFALLDAHPDCEMVSETNSTACLMPGEGVVAAPHQSLRARTAERVDRFLAACAAAADQSRKPIWGHKTTTEHVLGLYEPSIEDEGDFRPGNYFVERTRAIPTLFIVRDGRTCVPSKVRRTGQPLDVAIARWRFSIHLLEDYRQRHDRLLVVRMEDLVLKPVETLAAVCAFMELPYSAAMLAGTASGKIRPECRQMGFDESVVALSGNPPWVGLIEPELAMAGYPLVPGGTAA